MILNKPYEPQNLSDNATTEEITKDILRMSKWCIDAMDKLVGDIRNDGEPTDHYEQSLLELKARQQSAESYQQHHS